MANGSNSACGARAPNGSSAPRSTTRSTPCTGCKTRSTSAPAGCSTTRCAKSPPQLGWPVYLVPIDEVAYYSATVGTNIQQKEFNACNRDIVARGRAPGIIPVEATQRPSADIIPTSLRDLFGYRWAFRCSTEASSDTILGHGWANAGYSATEIDPQARGVSWLRAEDGIPRRVKAAYLSDEEIIHLAAWAAQARATHPASEQVPDADTVVPLRRDGDAA